MKLPITVTMITKNEAHRIEDALKSIQFASEIIVIDSESTDNTVEIAKKYGAKVIVTPFKGFGQQKNQAHELASTDWVLNIDADERVNSALADEIAQAIQRQNFDGYFVPRRTWYIDRWIDHSGWYPNHLLRLCRKTKGRWTTPIIHEELKIQGSVGAMKHPLEHFSFPTVRSHIEKNLEYAERARHQNGGIKSVPGVFGLFFQPLWKLLSMYVFKGGFLDGRAGWVIAVNSAYSTFLKYAYEWEAKRIADSDRR